MWLETPKSKILTIFRPKSAQFGIFQTPDKFSIAKAEAADNHTRNSKRGKSGRVPQVQNQFHELECEGEVSDFFKFIIIII